MMSNGLKVILDFILYKIFSVQNGAAFIWCLPELGVAYIAPEDHVSDKPAQNGTVNGKAIREIVDPYDDLIKNHLQKEEKIKVESVFQCHKSIKCVSKMSRYLAGDH